MASRRAFIQVVTERDGTKVGARVSTGLLPPTEQVLGPLFYLKVFDRAERLHYVKGDCIHVATLHRLIRRLSDVLGSTEMLFDPHEIFDKSWLTWRDIRKELEGGGSKMHVVIKRHPLERVNSIMAGDGDAETGGSYSGFCWSIFSFVLIMLSIASIMSEQLQGYDLQNMIVVVFTFDYLVKLICSPYVRPTMANIDVLVEKVVPDSESNMLQPEELTKGRRVLSYLTAPMNIVDLASILPFWIDIMGADSGLRLGFLRILRILRVVRLLKAGNFSETLQVLAETMRRSIDSFVVMIIWILIIATLVGTVMNMFEEYNGRCENPDDPDGDKIQCKWTFDSVATSVYWVIGRLCNMHGSLLAGKQIPKEDISFALVLFLGICKGCCLVVPVGQIATAFTAADRDFKRAKGITSQIFLESQLPLGTEWVKDRRSPFVEIDILPAEEEISVGAASFNVPLKHPSRLSATIDIPITSKIMHHLFSSEHPYMRIKVDWEPHGDFQSGKIACPRGTLTLTNLGGFCFRGSSDQQWRVLFRVPVGLHGEGAMQEWTTEPSKDGAPQPKWDSAAEGQSFEIKWIEKPERPAEAKEAYKLDDLLADMKAREERIGALEKVLQRI